MLSRETRIIRKSTNVVLDALLHSAEAACGGQPLSLDLLRAIVAQLKDAPEFEDFYARTYNEIRAIFEAFSIEQKRQNVFGRLIIHPLSVMLDQGILSRQILPNIFSFIHLVIGDEAEVYASRCQDIVKILRDEFQEDFTWETFYHTEEAKRMLWSTLVRIATSFKRWDLRKDWFMKLMQYTPSTVSLSTNAFVVRERGVSPDEPRAFSEREFYLFFHALFSPLVGMPPEDEALFQKIFGMSSAKMTGPFMTRLAPYKPAD